MDKQTLKTIDEISLNLEHIEKELDNLAQWVYATRGKLAKLKSSQDKESMS